MMIIEHDCMRTQQKLGSACTSTYIDQSSQVTLWEAKDSKCVHEDIEYSGQPKWIWASESLLGKHVVL